MTSRAITAFKIHRHLISMNLNVEGIGCYFQSALYFSNSAWGVCSNMLTHPITSPRKAELPHFTPRNSTELCSPTASICKIHHGARRRLAPGRLTTEQQCLARHIFCAPHDSRPHLRQVLPVEDQARASGEARSVHALLWILGRKQLEALCRKLSDGPRRAPMDRNEPLPDTR